MQPVVIGAGIAGLSAAHYLSKLLNSPIIILEASTRPGGWIRSVNNFRGTLYEIGPRTIRIAGQSGSNTLGLVEELGLDSDVRPVLKSSPAAKNRMLYVNGKLHSLPNSIVSLFKTVEPFTSPIITAAWTDLKTKPKITDDDSLYNFVERRLGPELAELAISPMICGICAGDAKSISVNFLMSNQFRWEQTYGGIIKGLVRSFGKSAQFPKSNLFQRARKENWSVWSLNGGLETLPLRLYDKLNQHDNVQFHFKSSCDGLRFTKTHVEMNVNGKPLLASHIFCAIPSYQAAKLFSYEHKELKDDLSAIPFVNVAVVNLEFLSDVLPLQGFGFLVPPNQNLPILGVIFDTCCFPQDGKTVLTVMMGGHWFEKYFGRSPQHATLLHTALNHVRSILNIDADPSDSNVSILKNCIPQYIVGHNARIERIRSYVSSRNLPITFVGSSYDGVGVNDVILSTKRAVEQSSLIKNV